MNGNDEKLDKVLILLLGGILFFVGCLFSAEIWFKDDGQLFTSITALLSGFAGSFFTRLKPRDQAPSLPISDKSTVDVQATLHQEPPKL